MFSIKAHCRTDQVKANGENNITLLVRKTGYNRLKIKTDLSVNPNFFNNTTGKFTRGSGDMMKLNARLDKILARLNEYVLDHPKASPEDVRDFYRNKRPEDFLSYAREELARDRDALSFSGWKQYCYCLNVLEKNWPNSEIKFSDLTADNFLSLEYALKVGGLGINTRRHVFKTLRKYTLRALSSEKIANNPFRNYKVGTFVNGERQYIDLDELERLKELWGNRDQVPVALHGTLIHFLHSCHCGLRSVDSRMFEATKHVKDGFIVMMPSKSKDLKLQRVRVPINDFTKEIHLVIDRYSLSKKTYEISAHLKKLCELAKIDKHITFHCSRHSFAINSLVMGVPLEVVSKWLGHASLSTTQIYAKVVDSLSGAEMEKWNRASKTLSMSICNESDTFFISLEELGIRKGSFATHEEAIQYIQQAFI